MFSQVLISTLCQVTRIISQWEIPCQTSVKRRDKYVGSARCPDLSCIINASSVNHGLAGDLLLPNTGCVIFWLHITVQTMEEIEER